MRELNPMSLSLGTMSVYKLHNWQDQSCGSVDEAVTAFLTLGEAIAARWIQTSKGVMLLQMVPGVPDSGGIYLFDRQHDDWYMLSFELGNDEFTSEEFDRIFREYSLFGLVERPSLSFPFERFDA